MMSIGIVVALLVLAGIGGGIYMMSRPTEEVKEEVQAEEKPKRRTRTEQYDNITIDKRPYIAVSPDASGRNVTITFYNMKERATSVDYELEYQAGELLQAAFGTIEIDNLPINKEILLGSRSAGGATTYHEDVKGGTLVTRFKGGEQYAFKSDWNFINNSKRLTTLRSKDEKFELKGPDIAKLRLVIITNSPGYPEKLPGAPVSALYAVSAPTALSGEATATITLSEETPDAKIAVWDGKTWETVATEVDSTTATAEVSLGQLFVAVK